MQNEPKYQLAEFDKEEIKVIEKEITELLSKHSAQFIVSPLINKDGTLGAQLQVLRKIELVPKGIPSPSDFLPQNGENPETSKAH